MNFGSAPNLFAWLWQAFLRPHDGAQVPAADAPAESPLLPGLRQTREGLAPLAGRDANAARIDRALRRIEARLKRPPRLALMGDFNSGKSSLAHLLLGGVTPPGGVIPETRAPVLFRYAAKPHLFLIASDGTRHPIASGNAAPSLNGLAVRYVEAGLPLDLLRRIEIVDIPGTANPATATEAHALLPDIVRNVHFALWCTPSPQAWKGNEQHAWFAMPPRLKAASILVATQADRLREAADREKVLNRLSREAGTHFRTVVMISARQRAQTIELGATEREQAKAAGANMDLWYAQGGAALWQALNDSVATVTAAREAAAARAATRIAKGQPIAVKPVAAPTTTPAPVPSQPKAPVPAQPKAPPPPQAQPRSPAQSKPRPPVQPQRTQPQAQPKPQAQAQPQTQAPVQRIVHAPSQPSPVDSDLRDALLGLWSRRADAIAARVEQIGAPDEALLLEFAGELHRFANDALLPRLAQHYPRALCDDIAALFLCEPAMLRQAMSGRSAKLFADILKQLSEELSEALALAGAEKPA